MMDGWGGGMSAAGWILMGLFWVLLILVVVWAVTQLLPGRRAEQPREPEPDDDSPDAILARRLARGEIDIQSYDALRDRLHRTDAPAGKAEVT